MKTNFTKIVIITFLSVCFNTVLAQSGNEYFKDAKIGNEAIIITTPKGDVKITKVYNNVTKTYQWTFSKEDRKKLSNEIADAVITGLLSEMDTLKRDIQQIKSILLAEQNGKVKLTIMRDTVVQRDTITIEKVIFITDNSHLIHPFFIKSYTMKKSTWRWICNGVGGAGVVSGIGFCIASHNNYNNHKDNIAPTLTKHKDYYDNYKNYHCAAIGSFVVAGVAFLSNVLCSQVKNDIRFAPAVIADPQGNLQAGLSMTIKF
ncbi:hypothetical protein FACS189434_06030 [Bacteroidia bacterium]|nr:hypothetical protein FACS189434_06030 [Bacteroidia bacterium]